MTALSLRGVRGGVGTSSVLAAVGYALHTLGERVLMIDMCPENLLRLHFNLVASEKNGWARAMLDGDDWHVQAWSLAPTLALFQFQMAGLVAVPVQLPIKDRELCLVRRREGTDSVAATAFIETLFKVWKVKTSAKSS